MDQPPTEVPISQEKALELSFERLIHAVQSQLQGLIAAAANLACHNDVTPELRNEAYEVLAHANALSTIVHTNARYHQKYDFELVRLEDLVNQSRMVYLPQANRRNIAIQVALGAWDELSHARREPVVPASSLHLQYALNNLVHNAIKYSFDGSAERAARVIIIGYPYGAYYCVSISNVGYGILPDEIREGKVFRDQYQGALIGLHHRTGSGKGLFFTKSVVEQHGGRVEVNSIPQTVAQGVAPYETTFRVYLPFNRMGDRPNG